MNRLAAQKTRHRAEDEGRLEAVRRKIASMIRAIEDGMYQSSMKERMAELEAEKVVLEERLATAPEPPKIRLHPNLPGLYREKVAALEQALADPAIKAEAAEVIRSQIERLTLPRTPRAVSRCSCTATCHASCSSARRVSTNTNAPAVVDRGVNCRWLRGQDLDFVHFS